MARMKAPATVMLMVVSLAAVSLGQTRPTTAASGDDAAGWRPLFNGKDLSGWYTFLTGEAKGQDATHVFTVDDGAIHCYQAASATTPTTRPTTGYIATNDAFSNYRLRFQYKWGAKPKGKRNAGLLYHVQDPGGARPGIVWPICIQCQVMEQSTGDIVAMAASVTTTVDPATEKNDPPTYRPAADGGVKHTTPQTTKDQKITHHPSAEVDDWNTVEVIVRGDGATHIVNGKIVNEFTDARIADREKPDGPWVPLKKGRIGFQAEGVEILYRNIEIKPIE